MMKDREWVKGLIGHGGEKRLGEVARECCGYREVGKDDGEESLLTYTML